MKNQNALNSSSKKTSNTNLRSYAEFSAIYHLYLSIHDDLFRMLTYLSKIGAKNKIKRNKEATENEMANQEKDSNENSEYDEKDIQTLLILKSCITRLFNVRYSELIETC